jgi:Kef-type K+ transport system membrane component KefB/mannitol/fructose-specific phosphotransferase system IIA component (Ntr-type)
MSGLSHHDTVTLFLSLAILLGAARLLGELALRFRQPAVLGELLAGILLGPTLFGAVAPELNAEIFPASGPVAIALAGLMKVAISLFLLVAGMEVDLSTVWRQGKTAVTIGIVGILFPYTLGFFTAYYAPATMGAEPDANRLVFALFFATALSISALPVIAKTLMDLKLFRTDLGMVVIASAIFDDLTGWIIFAVLLAMIGQESGFPIPVTIGLTLGFVVTMLTVGRWLVHRSLPWIQAHTSWPGGVLGFAVTCAMACAAFTEWIGIHAIFGAFIFGVALGDSSHLRERTRATIEQFISFIFAPLFFAGVGLHVNFIEGFDARLVLVVLLVATVGKVVGCGIGARLCGFSERQSLATGLAMNSRGAMEIILGSLALEAGLIRERMFVALVVMALVTSMASGPLIKLCLRQRAARHFTDFLSKNAFCRLMATDRTAAIQELVEFGCRDRQIDPQLVAALVLAREGISGTSLDHGVAIPHARTEQLTHPMVVVGVSEEGIDWNSADGELTGVVVLIVTPRGVPEIQLELLADVARTFHDAKRVNLARQTMSYTEFLACVKSDLRPRAEHRQETNQA